MTTDDDGWGRLLQQAFDAKARAAVSDDRPVPTLHESEARFSRRPRGWVAPMLAAAAVAVVAAGVAVMVHSPSHPSPAATKPTTSAPAAVTSVPVSVAPANGARVGVGMPIVVTFPIKITDGAAFAKATTVTANGTRVDGAWYFAASDPRSGHVMEAHYRTRDYWPAHAQIHVSVAAKGLSAGTGLVFANDVALDFTTGPATIVTVDSATHRLTISVDGAPVGSYPVSLGAPQTPTSRGIKVIMAKRDHICLHGPGYDECGIRYAQQLTANGEYLLAAPWNLGNLGRANTSQGSTEMSTADAQTLYRILEVGDVVEYPDAAGRPVPFGSGYGDWTVSWPVWLGGGAVPTR